MNWDAIGAIGEVIGAFAVFVTLVYLAIQIRQNTKAVHSAALDSSVNGISTARQSLFSDDELSLIYLKANADPDSLTDVERLRFRLLAANMMLSASNIYSQTRFSDLPTSTWDSTVPIVIRFLSNPGGAWFWENHRMEFDPEFRKELDKLLANLRSDT